MFRADPTQIQKILLITLSNIGDVILTTPVISLLRERYPSSYLTVLVGPKALSLFTNCRTINEVIPFDKRASWLEHLSLILKLRKEKFDLVVDLRNTAIPLLIGARHRTSLFIDRSSISMRERHLNRLRFLFPIESCKNHFDFFSVGEKNSVLQKLKSFSALPPWEDFIVLAPAAGSELKRWPISGFAQVAEHFLKMGRAVVLIGAEGERYLGDELQARISKPLINLIGSLSLRELAALLDHATLVIANDSAVMHLANELGRPTVSIFGPTNEKKYGQTAENRRIVRLHLECTPCEQARCRLHRRMCLDDLAAETVIHSSEDLLAHVPH